MTSDQTPPTPQALAEELKRRADPAGCTQEPINGARIDCRTWHIGRPYSRWCRSCVLLEAAAALLAAQTRERTFPIAQADRRYQGAPHPRQIPWSIAMLAYGVYSQRHGSTQSLERLAERGGFHPAEMDDFLPDWRGRCDEIASLRARADQAESSLTAMRAAMENAQTIATASLGTVAMDPNPPRRALRQIRDLLDAALHSPAEARTATCSCQIDAHDYSCQIHGTGASE